MDSYERHEFSDVYPHWVVNDMVADMREHGWDGPPILLYEGKILDGFHRSSAAMIAEVEAVFEEFHGTRIEAARKVYRANLYREMTAGQRAACKIKLMELAGTMLLDQGGNRRSEDFKRNQVPVENVPEPLPVYESIRSASTPVNEEEPRFFTADEMASVTGVSERTVRDIHTAEKGIGMDVRSSSILPPASSASGRAGR